MTNVHSIMVKSKLRGQTPWSQMLALSRMGYVTLDKSVSLCLNFVICKMIIIVPTSQGCYEN